MYSISLNGEEKARVSTLEEALTKRNELVKDTLSTLYDNDEIDKYAVEDWMWGLDENKDLEFYVDEAYGYEFKIEEDRELYKTIQDANIMTIESLKNSVELIKNDFDYLKHLQSEIENMYDIQSESSLYAEELRETGYSHEEVEEAVILYNKKNDSKISELEDEFDKIVNDSKMSQKEASILLDNIPHIDKAFLVTLNYLCLKGYGDSLVNEGNLKSFVNKLDKELSKYVPGNEDICSKEELIEAIDELSDEVILKGLDAVLNENKFYEEQYEQEEENER